VYMGFGFSDATEDGQARGLYAVAEGAPVDDGINIGQVTVCGMVTMVMIVLQVHVNTLTVNAALGIIHDLQFELVRQAELGKLTAQQGFVNAKRQHGGKIHVATDSAEAVIVEHAHGRRE